MTIKFSTKAVLSAAALLASGYSNAARAATAPLTWAPPTLTSPTVIDMAKVLRDAPSWKVTPGHLDLDKTKDYIIKMPSVPMTSKGGLGIIGGHNVVVIGGEIRFDEAPAEGSASTLRRGLYIKESTGTVHVEGLRIAGQHIAEGINIDVRNPGAIVQVQNMRIGRTLGSREGHHADVLQTWGGPSTLRVDRLTGFSNYQGFFLNPLDFSDEPVDLFDFRNINLVTGAYALYQVNDFPVDVQNVWVQSETAAKNNANDLLWPKIGAASWRNWSEVQIGSPPGGDFVPEGLAGVNYVSPGYVPEPTILGLTATLGLLALRRRRTSLN